jgi:hypothetical protein
MTRIAPYPKSTIHAAAKGLNGLQVKRLLDLARAPERPHLIDPRTGFALDRKLLAKWHARSPEGTVPGGFAVTLLGQQVADYISGRRTTRIARAMDAASGRLE